MIKQVCDATRKQPAGHGTGSCLQGGHCPIWRLLNGMLQLPRRQREWPPALQPAVDFVRERWSEEQQTVGGLIGVNALVHLLWRVPGLQVGFSKTTAHLPGHTTVSLCP